jgi:flavin-binding protein dodecin
MPTWSILGDLTAATLHAGGSSMSDTFKLITLVGVSTKSYADATQNAITEAAKTVRSLAWFEARELRGRIKDGKIEEYQVKVDVGFKVE